MASTRATGDLVDGRLFLESICADLGAESFPQMTDGASPVIEALSSHSSVLWRVVS
jgi:hypothetical protein